MSIPTNPNERGSPREPLKPPEIEWVENTPKSTQHLPCADSSWLESMSYDGKTSRLTVVTKSGSSWQHAQVSAGQFEELQLSASKGSYYTRSIKGNHPTTTIKKIPKLKNFPKELTNGKTKIPDAFKNPLTEGYTNRYGVGGKGRYQ